MNKQEKIKSLMIALDMLDRVEGTAIYNIQKKLYGYTDTEYQEMIKYLKELYKKIKDQ